jgi:hypothetical protein
MLFANYVYAPPTILVRTDHVFETRANFIAPYDMTALLFICAGLLAIHDRRWRAYYLLLPIAMLNRETAGILVLVFAAVMSGQMPRRAWALHLGAQIAAVTAIKLLLIMIFARNGGSAATFAGLDRFGNEGLRLSENLSFLASAAAAPLFGFLWLPWALAWVRTRDAFVCRASLAIPPFLAAMLVAGNFYEFRIFTEILPLITLIIATGLPEWLPWRGR